MQSQGRSVVHTTIAGRLIVVAVAVAAGILLQRMLGERLAAILAHAEHDRAAARVELAGLIRTSVSAACGLTAALALWILIACRNPAAARSFPPPGFLSIGARRAVSGPRARTLTRIGFWLGLSLLLVSSAGIALGWRISAVLLACRA
jgi:hypothetical protein